MSTEEILYDIDYFQTLRKEDPSYVDTKTFDSMIGELWGMYWNKEEKSLGRG